MDRELEQRIAQAKYATWFLSLTEAEQEAIQAQNRVMAAAFSRLVEVGLSNESTTPTPRRFDEIADQIEAAAPNWDAVYQGIRLLGKWYSLHRTDTTTRNVTTSLTKALGLTEE